MRVAIIGCGYVGFRLAQYLAKQGHSVWGARRQITDPTEFTDAGITPLELDVTQPETLSRLPTGLEAIVNSVSSSRGNASVYQQVYRQGTANLIESLSKHATLQHYLHISSTSVYGQTDGSVIREDAPREPNSDTAQILVETENLLLEAVQTLGFPATLARVAGIYGPERGYLFQKFVSDEATMVGDGSRLINMIHVDDLVAALTTILERAQPGTAFNVADNCPTTQKEFFAWLADELDKPMPPSASPESLKRRKRAITNKRVCNRRLREDLGFQFRFPTFREGYAPELSRVKQRKA